MGNSLPDVILFRPSARSRHIIEILHDLALSQYFITLSMLCQVQEGPAQEGDDTTINLCNGQTINMVDYVHAAAEFYATCSNHKPLIRAAKLAMLAAFSATDWTVVYL
jgi:hypothetical protein